MNRSLIVIAWSLLIGGCNQSASKIDYENQIDTIATVIDISEDTTKILVSELPVKIDCTDVLIYAVSLVDLQTRNRSKKIGSGSYSGSDFGSRYFNGNDMTGRFTNLIFEDLNANRKVLTNHKMMITRAYFLRSIFDVTKKRYLMYTIYDRDTNGDGRFNTADLESLYLSDINGEGFSKITKELHEFYDYQVITEDNKLYFRTLEDINKDGKLNNQDKFHHYKIEFDENGYDVREYDPLDVFDN